MDTESFPTTYTAFEGCHRIASGHLREIALAVKLATDRGTRAPVLVFDNRTSTLLELDLRGSSADVLKRLNPPAAAPDEPMVRGRGRPRLGVVAREVTLLPRHWDWLNSQPGGASVALRKLVEEARQANAGQDRVRLTQESAYRFMSAIAGDLPGFEEAARALFAGDSAGFSAQTAPWPADVRSHAQRLAANAFTAFSEKNTA
jgi:hypothetical protein